MKHEEFPVKGFEFMNEPATDEQKRIIIEICQRRHIPIDTNGPWPEPFSKWDAANMIQVLKGNKQEKQVIDIPPLAKFAGSLTGMAGGTINPRSQGLPLCQCGHPRQDHILDMPGKSQERICWGANQTCDCAKYIANNIPITPKETDDRCLNCKEFDNDGCPYCGPNTIKKVFNPTD